MDSIIENEVGVIGDLTPEKHVGINLDTIYVYNMIK